jgi:hypothetical protein
MVKPEVDTLPMVPDDPPAAGPDRALEPSPADELLPAELLTAALGAAAVEEDEDEDRPTETPIAAAHVSAVAAIHAPFLFDSSRRTLARRPCSAVVPDAALLSSGPAGSYSFMMALLPVRHLYQAWLPYAWGL